VLALALRLLPVFVFPSIHYPDEIFQAVEQAHRLVYGTGLVPWEFVYGTRSWLLPSTIAWLMEFARIFGDGPDFYMPVIGIAFAALSASSALCAFLWGRRFYGLPGGIVAGAFAALWIDLVYFAPHPLSEVAAAHVLVIGAYLAKGMDAFHAACAGVHVHARAGQIAAERIGTEGVIARDVIEALPRALGARS